MNGRRNSIDCTTTNGQRRNFFHLCGSPISTAKQTPHQRQHRGSFDESYMNNNNNNNNNNYNYNQNVNMNIGSPNQVRSPEALSPPALNMKDVGDVPKKRAMLATAATEQDDLFAAYDTCASSFAMDKSMRMMSDSDDDDYDEGAETDTNSSTHMRVEDAREARIPLFLSDDFLPQQAAGCNGTEGFSRVGGRRGSLIAAHESIDLKDLALDRVIGEGAFGKVYKGMWKQKPVAVKVLIHQDLRPDVVREFETEVQIMSVLNHPNICMLLGACLEPSNRALVLELVEQGSLWSVLRSRRRQINDAVRAKFILDTAMGMNYLHQFKRPILHRDMKSPNLLVQNDFSIKISDFGLARVKAQIQTMTGNCGTVQWMAPEVLGNQKYTEKADVFSFGIVIWEICTGRCPYEGMVQIQAALGVLNHDLRPSIPETCPRFFARLMRACWNREPSMRPTFAEIIKAFELYQKSVSSSNFSR